MSDLHKKFMDNTVLKYPYLRSSSPRISNQECFTQTHLTDHEVDLGPWKEKPKEEKD